MAPILLDPEDIDLAARRFEARLARYAEPRLIIARGKRQHHHLNYDRFAQDGPGEPGDEGEASELSQWQNGSYRSAQRGASARALAGQANLSPDWEGTGPHDLGRPGGERQRRLLDNAINSRAPSPEDHDPEAPDEDVEEFAQGIPGEEDIEAGRPYPHRPDVRSARHLPSDHESLQRPSRLAQGGAWSGASAQDRERVLNALNSISPLPEDNYPDAPDDTVGDTDTDDDYRGAHDVLDEDDFDEPDAQPSSYLDSVRREVQAHPHGVGSEIVALNLGMPHGHVEKLLRRLHAAGHIHPERFDGFELWNHGPGGRSRLEADQGQPDAALLAPEQTQQLAGKPPGARFADDQVSALTAQPRRLAARARRFSEHGGAHVIRGMDVFAAGTHRGKTYTTADLDDMVSNFQRFSSGPQPLMRVPVVLGHEETQEYLDRSDLPAAGWLSRLWRDGNVLKADVEDVAPEVARLIRGKAYRTVSSEVYDEPPEGIPGAGKMERRVALLGGDIPQIKGRLKDIPAPEPHSERSSRYEPVRFRLRSAERSRRGTFHVFCEVARMAERCGRRYAEEGEGGNPGPDDIEPTLGVPAANGAPKQRQPSYATLHLNSRKHRDVRLAHLEATVKGEHEALPAYADWLEDNGSPRAAGRVRRLLKNMKARYPDLEDWDSIPEEDRRFLAPPGRAYRIAAADLLQREARALTPQVLGENYVPTTDYAPTLDRRQPRQERLGRILEALGHHVQWHSEAQQHAERRGKVRRYAAGDEGELAQAELDGGRHARLPGQGEERPQLAVTGRNCNGPGDIRHVGRATPRQRRLLENAANNTPPRDHAERRSRRHAEDDGPDPNDMGQLGRQAKRDMARESLERESRKANRDRLRALRSLGHPLNDRDRGILDQDDQERRELGLGYAEDRPRVRRYAQGIPGEEDVQVGRGMYPRVRQAVHTPSGLTVEQSPYGHQRETHQLPPYDQTVSDHDRQRTRNALNSTRPIEPSDDPFPEGDDTVGDTDTDDDYRGEHDVTSNLAEDDFADDIPGEEDITSGHTPEGEPYAVHQPTGHGARRDGGRLLSSGAATPEQHARVLRALNAARQHAEGDEAESPEQRRERRRRTAEEHGARIRPPPNKQERELRDWLRDQDRDDEEHFADYPSRDVRRSRALANLRRYIERRRAVRFADEDDDGPSAGEGQSRRDGPPLPPRPRPLTLGQRIGRGVAGLGGAAIGLGAGALGGDALGGLVGPGLGLSPRAAAWLGVASGAASAGPLAYLGRYLGRHAHQAGLNDAEGGDDEERDNRTGYGDPAEREPPADYAEDEDDEAAAERAWRRVQEDERPERRKEQRRLRKASRRERSQEPPEGMTADQRAERGYAEHRQRRSQ